jgi:LPXTG-motif cell wall-anchored protein
VISSLVAALSVVTGLLAYATPTAAARIESGSQGNANANQPLPPTVVTEVSRTTISAGNTLTDTAQLTGQRGTVTGTAQFQLCSDTTTGCPQGTGTNIGSPITLVNGSATSPEFGADLAPGNYCVGLLYVNDGRSFYSNTYAGGTGGIIPFWQVSNECFRVTKRAPTISTSLSANSIVAGGSVHDSATLTGATPNAGGTVSYRFYPALAKCEQDTAAFPGTVPTGGTSAGTVMVTDAVVPNSNDVTFPNVGTFFWAAFYSGDRNNAATASVCTTEALMVSMTHPLITTSLSHASIPVGGSVNDSATLTGATPNAGGTVSYRFYAALAKCEQDTAAFPGTVPTGGTSAGTVTVTNGVVPNSNTVTFPNVGTFFWAAFYSGDRNNAAAVSGCRTEAVVVQKLTPAITTSLSHASIPVGGSVHDSATLTGATSEAGGTVEYRFYPSLGACDTDTGAFPGTAPTGGTSAGTVTVTDAVVPNSNDVTFPNAGTFFWAAFYSGDRNNAAAVSGCRTETVVVRELTPAITTSLSHASIPVGGSVHDSATLTGATQSAGGTVEYRFYPSLGACDTDTGAFPGTAPTGGTSAGTVTVTDAVVPNSNDVTFPNAGTFFWAAFYSGDANNAATDSACENEGLTVMAVPPTPTPTPTTTPSLPVTGSPTAPLAALAGGLVAAGLLVLLVARRRRRTEL